MTPLTSRRMLTALVLVGSMKLKAPCHMPQLSYNLPNNNGILPLQVLFSKVDIKNAFGFFLPCVQRIESYLDQVSHEVEKSG
jgi:hypothetical protein